MSYGNQIYCLVLASCILVTGSLRKCVKVVRPEFQSGQLFKLAGPTHWPIDSSWIGSNTSQSGLNRYSSFLVHFGNLTTHLGQYLRWGENMGNIPVCYKQVWEYLE